MEKINLRTILEKHLNSIILKNDVINDCNVDLILDAMQEACEESLDAGSNSAVLSGFNSETNKELYTSGLEYLHIRNSDSNDEYWTVDNNSILNVKNNIIRK